MEGGKKRLRIGAAVLRCQPQPARPFRAAWRHARTLEIEASHHVFGLGDPRPCRYRHEREGFCRLTALSELHRAAQGRSRESKTSQSIQHCHGFEALFPVPRTSNAKLGLPHRLLADRQHHAEEIFEHGPLADLDVGSHRHAGADGETGGTSCSAT